jgi:hypothetical protein
MARPREPSWTVLRSAGTARLTSGSIRPRTHGSGVPPADRGRKAGRRRNCQVWPWGARHPAVAGGQRAMYVTVAVEGSGHGSASQKVTLQVLGPGFAAASAAAVVSCR